MFCLELHSHSSSPPRSSSSLCMQPWTSLSKQLYLFPDVDYASFGDQHIFVPLSYLFMHYFADRPSIHTIIPTLALPDKAHDLIGHYTYYSLSRYRLTDWTLLPSTAFNHVSMCSQSCANQTHLDTSCCWQCYNVLSHVFIMVSRYR